MTITLYGIPNCDTVKKARTWLAAQQLDFHFHDFKKQGLERATVDAASALDLMLENPSIIKRPVLDKDGQFSVAFSDAQYKAIFSV